MARSSISPKRPAQIFRMAAMRRVSASAFARISGTGSTTGSLAAADAPASLPLTQRFELGSAIA